MKILFTYLLLLTCMFFMPIAATESFVEVMQEKLNLLGNENSFVYVDLQLTNEEFELLDQLKFVRLPEGKTVQYDRFGDLNLLQEELPSFLKDIGNEDSEVIAVTTDIISRTVQNLVNASRKNSAWVCVRASTPSPAFDIPRWHMDGTYYGPYPYPGLVFKFAAALKGSSTLLYNVSEEQREIFIANQMDRTFLSEFLDIKKAESPERGQGVLFIVGNDEIGGVHSEPKMDENRLFFSILIGDVSEIDELHERWYPKNQLQ